MNPAWIRLFNKQLPEEIILKIVRYLSFEDIIMLCISKLFFPTLLYCPWFFNQLYRYIFHCIMLRFYKKTSFFLLNSVIPLKQNGEFYFAINILRLPFFQELWCPSTYEMFPVLQFVPIMFHSFNQYISSPDQVNFVRQLRYYPKCHKACLCLDDKYCFEMKENCWYSIKN
jgi:hypothetical protein